jgi:hypothetical protein
MDGLSDQQQSSETWWCIQGKGSSLILWMKEKNVALGHWL